MFTNLEDLQKFGKEQFEAVSAAASTVSKSVQELATEATDFSKKSLEDSSALFEKLLAAKSLESAFQIQSEFTKSAYEGWVSKSARFGELYANIAREAFRPVETALSKGIAPVR